MAHEKLNINVTQEWARNQAAREPKSGFTSVGGLAYDVHELTAVKAKHFSDKTDGPRRVMRQYVDDDSSTRTDSSQVLDSRRQSLGKFVELSRRRLQLSVEQLAEKADVDLAELLAIETAEHIAPDLRTICRLAEVLNIRPEPLLELAGLSVPKTTTLVESAMRFTARSEPMQALSSDEEAALNWFVKELSKS